jgi:hypothetical protein
LRKKLVGQGLKKFPEAPNFPLLAGRMELERGPRWCDRGAARRHFERARDLARKSGPQYATIAEQAEHHLTFLAEATALPRRAMPTRGRRASRFDEDDQDEGDAPESMDAGGIFAAFAKTCRAMGLDPEEVLEDLASGGGPFRFPHPGEGKRGKGKKSRS